MVVALALYTSWRRPRSRRRAACIRDFGEVEQLQVSVKGPGDFVSTADLKAEQDAARPNWRGRGPASAS